ncbi:MAG TPA: 6-phosphogluconolactonase, partial [Gemmatimonadaceae bacterium]
MDPGARRASAPGSEARDPVEERGPLSLPGQQPVAAESRERIRTLVFDDHDALAVAVAHRIATVIRERSAAGRQAVLGLATGSTPLGVYRELVRLYREDGLSFRDVVTFNLDEYYPIDPRNPHSYHRFMWDQLFSHVDIAPANVHIPRGDVERGKVAAECAAYEQAIVRAGGIDLQILGIGKTGHIGFNEPGSGANSR